MSLRQELDRYLSVRRSLGYDLGTSERVLRRFIDFAEAERRRLDVEPSAPPRSRRPSR